MQWKQHHPNENDDNQNSNLNPACFRHCLVILLVRLNVLSIVLDLVFLFFLLVKKLFFFNLRIFKYFLIHKTRLLIITYRIIRSYTISHHFTKLGRSFDSFWNLRTNFRVFCAKRKNLRRFSKIWIKPFILAFFIPFLTKFLADPHRFSSAKRFITIGAARNLTYVQALRRDYNLSWVLSLICFFCCW